MEDPAHSPSPTRRAQAEETIRKLRGKGLYLWPLLWLVICPFAGIPVTVISEVLASWRQHHDVALAIAGAMMTSAVPWTAGFWMGRNYRMAKEVLAAETGEPPPSRWTHPLLFAFAQWGLTLLYAGLLMLAVTAVIFGACLLMANPSNFR